MATYHGKKGQVYISTTGTGAAAALKKASNWTIDSTTDKVETTSFGDANKTYVQGLPDIKGTIAGFWDDTEDSLFTAAGSADGCKLYLYPDAANRTGKYWYGPAWVDYSVDVAVDGAVKITGNFVANGNWGKV